MVKDEGEDDDVYDIDVGSRTYHIIKSFHYHPLINLTYVRVPISVDEEVQESTAEQIEVTEAQGEIDEERETQIDEEREPQAGEEERGAHAGEKERESLVESDGERTADKVGSVEVGEMEEETIAEAPVQKPRRRRMIVDDSEEDEREEPINSQVRASERESNDDAEADGCEGTEKKIHGDENGDIEKLAAIACVCGGGNANENSEPNNVIKEDENVESHKEQTNKIESALSEIEPQNMEDESEIVTGSVSVENANTSEIWYDYIKISSFILYVC